MDDKPVKALLIKENPEDAKLIKNLLSEVKDAQFDLEWTDRLSSGLERLRAGEIDIAFLDLMLLDSQGLDTLIKAHTHAPEVPFLVLTDQRDETLAIEALRKGAHDYLVKDHLNANMLSRIIRYTIVRSRVEKELLASEARFRTVIEKNADAIIIISNQGIVRFANPAAEILSGLKTEEFVGTKFEYPLREAEISEIEISCPRGEKKIAAMSVVKMMWEGEMVYLVSLHNITERKQAEKIILQQMVTLKNIDEIKSEFVSIASHELRTPLSAIKSAVQLILTGQTGEINENQTKFLSLADRNINRLTSILNNLLDISRIESGKVDMKFEALDLTGTIEFIISSLKPQADKKNIRIKMEVLKGLPSVNGDQDKIEQILTNLIGNAIKFTPEGGKISVSARLPNKDGIMMHISVRDSGIGISKDQQEKIFERFHLVEGSLQRSVSGTGLGLAITKGLVEAHQGKIWVESELEKGSIFFFSLPIMGKERRDIQFRYIMDSVFQRARENKFQLTFFLVEVEEQRDEVRADLLEKLEARLKESVYRKTDTVFRRDKEKLLAILCEVDKGGARVIRQRILEEAEKYPNKVGMATYPDEAGSKRDLFRKAKNRLRG